MSEPSFAAVSAVLQALRELPPAEQRRRLAELCAGDGALQAEVESLLPHARAPDRRLEREPVPAGGAAALAERALAESVDAPGLLAPGSRIGAYTIVRQIGAGGMGTVCEARRDDGSRPVALKMLRPGSARPELLRRFRHEAEILARLRHPGIARLLESGSARTAFGELPWFAMELVDGLPLTAGADALGLSTQARVGLLATLCDILQHTHDQGIVHRDLKPANVLLDGEARLKVLDFGVARVTTPDSVLGTQHTATGQLVGTLQSMSPEQLDPRFGEVDARADVYALGALLYELLSGRPPFELAERSLPEGARLVLETRPATLTLADGGDPGELATIVARALRKRPERRYASAHELAADLRRWLDGARVLARPPSRLEELGRLVRRHRGLTLGLSLAFVTLTVALAGSLRQNGLIRDALQVSETQAARAHLAAAVAALEVDDPLSAAAHLDAIPPAQRTWEWRHTLARSDQSLALLNLDAATLACALAADDTTVLSVVADGRLLRQPVIGGQPAVTRLEGAGALGLARFSPEGTRLAALQTAPSPTLAVWDTADGRRLASWPAPTEPPPELVWGPGAERVAWLDERTLRCWRPGSGEPADELVPTQRPGNLSRLALGSDAVFHCDAFGMVERLALASADVRRAASSDPAGVAGSAAWSVRIPRSTRGVLALSADGRRLAHGSSSGRLTILDSATGATLTELTGHTDMVRALVWSRGDTQLVSAGNDGTLRCWDSVRWQPASVLSGHRGRVHELLASPGSALLLTHTGDGSARLWSPGAADELAVLRGHRSYVYDVAVSPDGGRVASASWDRSLALWDLATGRRLQSLDLDRRVLRVAWSPDGRSVAATLQGRSLAIVSPDDGQLRTLVATPMRDPTLVWTSADSLVLSDGSGHDERQRLFQLDLDGQGQPRGAARPLGPPVGPVTALALDPAGRALAVGGDHGVCLLDVAAPSSPPLSLLPAGTGAPRLLAFEPRGERLVGADKQGALWLWDLGHPESTPRLLAEAGGAVHALAFAPDGQRLAAGCDDASVRLYNAADGALVAQLRGHEEYVHGLSFAPDGGCLVSGSGDGTLRLWETRPVRERSQARLRAALR